MAWLLEGLLFGALAVAVVTDLRERRIPNWLTLPALAAALLLRLAVAGWDGPWGLGQGLIGMAIAFVPFFLLALAGGMGMGDVKLVAVVGACLGSERTLQALFCIAVVGGVQALVALVRARGGDALRRTVHLVARGLGIATAPPPAGAPVTVPYGVAIALGTAWAVLWSPWGS